MSLVYHLLDEQEYFSEFAGGAISRWAANMLRGGDEIIVAPGYDESWGFPLSRLYQLPRWSWTGKGPIHPILYRIPWLLQQAAYLPMLRPLLDRMKPGDLLYVHNRPEVAAVVATVIRGRGIRLVLHMHNSHLIHANAGQRRALRHIPLVFVSHFLQKEFQAAWPEHEAPTTVVYNGADEGKFFNAAQRNIKIPTVIFTGRLVEYKGAHILVEAMRQLHNRGVSIRCKIVGGSGFGKSRKTTYIRQLESQLPPNCAMIGYRSGDALAALLRESDIFCCPSIWNDPFPLAPLEAMASGLPVVASNVGGIPEALAWGGGRLVEPNQPEALASVLAALANDSAARSRLSEDARVAYAEHWRWSTVRHQYQGFVDAMLSAG